MIFMGDTPFFAFQLPVLATPTLTQTQDRFRERAFLW